MRVSAVLCVCVCLCVAFLLLLLFTAWSWPFLIRSLSLIAYVPAFVVLVPWCAFVAFVIKVHAGRHSLSEVSRHLLSAFVI